MDSEPCDFCMLSVQAALSRAVRVQILGAVRNKVVADAANVEIAVR
jgi:hypothetical protein